MFKVKAKHWLNIDGTWHGTGETFEVESIAGIREHVEVIAEAPEAVEPEPIVEPEPETEEEPKKEQTEEKPKASASRRGRKAQ